MGLLELAHVDGDDVVLAAVERLRQRQRRLRLAHAGGPDEEEHADGLARVVEARARGLDAPGDHLEAVALAHDAPAEGVGELEDGLDLVLDHPAHGDAGPVGDDGGDGLGVDAGQDQRRLALRLGELRLELAQLGRAAPRASAGSAASVSSRSWRRSSRMRSTSSRSSAQRCSRPASRSFSAREPRLRLAPGESRSRSRPPPRAR